MSFCTSRFILSFGLIYISLFITMVTLRDVTLKFVLNDTVINSLIYD